MEKQKVLIICYFFYPCNLPGAQRSYSWAKYLHESGLYPIVITRNWDHEIRKSSDLFVPAGDAVVHRKEDGYEIYYLPFEGGLRDNIINRLGEERLVLLRKVLTYLELMAQNFTSWFLSYRNFYSFARRLIKNDPGIRTIVTSAMPFGLFRICHKLHLKTGIPWIADYRDDWNTTSWSSNYSQHNQVKGEKPLPERLLSFIERRSEKRWLSSASMITSVSRYYVHKISNYVLRPGKVIYNGYDVDVNNGNDSMNAIFTISYIGNLYREQPVEIFLDGITLAMAELNDPSIEINFVGTGYDINQRQRLTEYGKAGNINLRVTDWMGEEEAYAFIRSSHLLLSVSYNGLKGVIPGKIFNYLAFHKPVLLCPSDHDELEETLLKSGLGIIADDAAECCKKIVEAYNCFLRGESMVTANSSFINTLSRKNQAKTLAAIIHQFSTVS